MLMSRRSRFPGHIVLLSLGLLAVAFLPALITMCSSSRSQPQPHLENVVLATQLDDDQRPVDQVEAYSPWDTFFASAQVADLAPGSEVTARWYRGDELIDEYSVRLEQGGSGYIGFRLQPKAGTRWPLGQNYRVDILLNDQTAGSLNFSVLPPPDAIPSRVRQVVTARAVDESFRPVEPSHVFAADETVHCAVNADLGQSSYLEAHWLYNNQQLPDGTAGFSAEANVQDTWIHFYLQPEGELQPGDYAVEIYLDGQLARRVDFVVTPAWAVKTGEASPLFTETITGAIPTPPQPVDPWFGPITFAEGIDSKEGPVNPGRAFPADIQEVFAFYDFIHLADGALYEQVWYRDGQEIGRGAYTWDLGAIGSNWGSLYDESGLPPGKYELVLLLNGQPLRQGKFTVLSPGEDAGPFIGAITFAAGRTAEDQPLEPSLRFRRGVTEVHAFFAYSGIPEGAIMERVWMLDGQPIHHVTETWNGYPNGRLRTSLAREDKFPPGSYELTVLVNGKEMRRAGFIVGGGLSLLTSGVGYEAKEPEASPTTTPTPPPTPDVRRVGVGQRTGTVSQTAIYAALSELRLYESLRWGFSLPVPAAWHVDETDIQITFSNAEETAGLIVIPVELPTAASVEQVADLFLQGMQTELPALTAGRRFAVRADDKAGVLDELRLRQGDLTVAGYLLTLVQDSRAYAILGLAEGNDPTEVKPLLDVVTRDFTFYSRQADRPAGLLAYTLWTGHNYEVWLLDLGKAAPKRLARLASEPSWSPLGRQIAFYGWTGRDGEPGVWVMNADGSGQRLLIPDPNANGINWSPDGRFIAYASMGPEVAQLMVYDLVEGAVRLVAAGDDPSWSPDGGRLVYRGCLEKGCGLLTVTVAPGEPQLLLALDGARSPAWSPDGRHIAFAVEANGKADIFIVKADGTDLRKLTEGPGWNVNPAWTPDGRFVLFRSKRGKQWSIYVVPSDGGEARKIIDADASPEWWLARMAVTR
ncbi:MAG TPA: hypothetical protein EYH31_11525 [Anaerolineae bacterium]|nr:hypothetical protein [Anaerolineae bacterium]